MKKSKLKLRPKKQKGLLHSYYTTTVSCLLYFMRYYVIPRRTLIIILHEERKGMEMKTFETTKANMWFMDDTRKRLHLR